MFKQATNYISETLQNVQLARLDEREMKVYRFLFRKAGNARTYCFIPQVYFSRATTLTNRQVKYVLDKLVKKGIIERQVLYYKNERKQVERRSGYRFKLLY